MHISIASILWGLGGNCILNWALLFFQRKHLSRSFLGVFSVSLAVVDTLLTLSITSLHLTAEGHLLGLKLTRYHVCLLVQILGEVYITLQWPVVVVAGLDHFFTVTRRWQASTRRSVCISVSGLLWSLSALYVFLSDFRPIMEEVFHIQIHQCWVFQISHILHIATFLLMLLGCAAVHAGLQTLKNPPLIDQITDHSRRSVVLQTLHIYLNTWALFLVIMAILLLLPVEIPAYLGLSVAWLCFLNSLLIAVVLCAVCPASQLAQGRASVPPDSFCAWRFIGGQSTTTQIKCKQVSC